MNALDLACFGGESEGLRCNAEEARRLVQVEPWLVPIRCRPEDRDLVMRPVCGDPLPCPAIAMPGHQAVAVENAGIRSSLAISTSCRMAAMISPEVLLRFPRRRFGRRSSVWAPSRCPAASPSTRPPAIRYPARKTAAENHCVALVDQFMNMDLAARPRLPGIKQLALRAGPVGVPSPSCSIQSDHTARSATSH